MNLEIRLLAQLGSSSQSLAVTDSFFVNLASSKPITKFAGGRKIETKQDLLAFFLNRSKHNIQVLHSLDLPPNSLQKGFIELGIFVDNTLQTIESDHVLSTSMGRQLESAKLIMHSIFSAMAIGSPKAIEFFPRLLQLLTLYPELFDDFQKLSSDCPSWMFLRWLPQLTALLDKPSGLPILPLILRIAKKYPNALRFPLTLSFEQYSFTPETAENAKLIKMVRNMIQSDAYDRFALELRRLEDPIHIFKDLCDRFESFISSSLSKKKEVLQQAFIEFKEICLETKRTGELFKKFAEKHTSKISGIFSNGNFDEKKMKELVGYKEKFGSEAESKPGKNLLKLFSSWLNEYQLCNVNDTDQLEIPGQYSGKSEPNVSEHVKIANFDPNVLVMSSMRRPKRIVMIGTDEKEYPWLVKGGEDLRLDQRIEQMFVIMNELMAQNSFCMRNHVSLATYKVVPMSMSLGLIEWVDGTKTLKACLADSPEFEKKFSEAMALYGEFVQKHGKSGQSFVACYEPFLQNATPKNVIENIQSICNRNRDSYLRQFFFKLTISPEAFFHIRSEFANSLAALNICSYLLGIGDRHLDNFLVDLKTGRIIGIDFGHAFGSATEVLPVPELVPFRLTNQMEKFLLPLGVQSLMANPMTNVLTSIQDGKGRLLNALNIFVNEPLLEWRKFAVTQMKKQGKKTISMGEISESMTAPAWYPQQKLDIAKRKLEGENCTYVTVDELTVGHEKRKFFKSMKGALMGDPAVNVRAKVGRICESPKEQVDCLIDLAMDPNVLGRAWVGWSPFM
ncbi:hypothetical protein HK100_011282 [Physocladia obscura]|uniref:non-specific serine/threonine protein kinase n=1 Tax=Physocladia obscura TaxID=109957 RepID=A0AAD5T9J3_9FUNG|nr:hypothetical protein HK100_011282 [Physocladia obscura]